MKSGEEVREKADPAAQAGLVLSKTDKEILRAVRDVKYGSVEITIHDAKVVQVERREKVRFSERQV